MTIIVRSDFAYSDYFHNNFDYVYQSARPTTLDSFVRRAIITPCQFCGAAWDAVCITDCLATTGQERQQFGSLGSPVEFPQNIEGGALAYIAAVLTARAEHALRSSPALESTYGLWVDADPRQNVQRRADCLLCPAMYTDCSGCGAAVLEPCTETWSRERAADCHVPRRDASHVYMAELQRLAWMRLPWETAEDVP